MMEIIKQTYDETPNVFGACRFRYIAILKMGGFYIVLRWIKFHNYTDGSVDVIDCDTDLLKAIEIYKSWGGICK